MKLNEIKQLYTELEKVFVVPAPIQKNKKYFIDVFCKPLLKIDLDLDFIIASCAQTFYKFPYPAEIYKFLSALQLTESHLIDKYGDATLIKAKKLYTEYPNKKGGLIAIESIIKAMEKIGYDKLLDYTKKFYQKQKEQNQEERFIISPKIWFDNEMWLDIAADETKKEKEF